ncbi:transposase [Streptomyces adustus]|uniref:transposase n=1 Tax=Streptomyces adustus TaxID=1609272 RepID=UPI0037140C95
MPRTTAEIGIDLGLGHFAVRWNSTRVDSPRFLRRAEKRPKMAQRGRSREEKGSSNRNRARVKAARTLARVTFQGCSQCGVKDGPKPQHVRAWTCRAFPRGHHSGGRTQQTRPLHRLTRNRNRTPATLVMPIISGEAR